METKEMDPNPLMMLWRIDDKSKPLSWHVRDAMAYYVKKYLHAPDVVSANPKELAEAIKLRDSGPRLMVCGLTVRESRLVIKGHLQVGVENPNAPPSPLAITVMQELTRVTISADAPASASGPMQAAFELP